MKDVIIQTAMTTATTVAVHKICENKHSQIFLAALVGAVIGGHIAKKIGEQVFDNSEARKN